MKKIAAGGMERFIPQGAAVLIKPNRCVPRPFKTGTTANPPAVAALAKTEFYLRPTRQARYDAPKKYGECFIDIFSK
jgi:hypothetical protein